MSSLASAGRHLRILTAIVWAASSTLIMQYWVGGSTIYRPALEPRIERYHQAILDNVPPEVTWDSAGMNTTNIRVGAVFLAEGIHRLTGMRVPKVYRTVDTVALFFTLLLLLVFLHRLVPSPYALIGALAFASVLPLTYQLFVSHPWDRLSVLMWVLLLMALERRRILLFAALLPVAMVIKFDVLLLPGLYFLLTVPLKGDRRALVRSCAVTVLLFGVTVGVYWTLRAARPGGFDPISLSALAVMNMYNFRAIWLYYPPLLGFAAPLLLAAVGFRRADRFARACAVFGVLLLLVFAARSMFEEFRTQVPVFLLLLPAALVGLRAFYEGIELERRGEPRVVKYG